MSSTLPGEAFGALIAEGPSDWQMFSADARGLATLRVNGVWRRPTSAGLLGRSGCEVEIRLCQERTGNPVTPALQWQSAETRSDGTWSALLQDIPCGSPYRLETRLNPRGNKTKEWAWRGDTRRFLAVGEVWVLAGQSNVSGYGAPPYPDEPEIGIHLFGQDGHWRLAAHPLHDGTAGRFQELVQPYVPGHSPFLHFAKRLKQVLGRPIGLIPAALGGSALQAWMPGAPLQQAMLHLVREARIQPAGLIFGQGESDAKGQASDSYGERFSEALAGWREALGNRDLPVITYQLGRYYSKNPGEDDAAWSRVREAQRRAAKAENRLAVLPALDLTLTDTIHFSSAANVLLGERFAEAAMGLRASEQEFWRAPDLASARLMDSRKVELSFAPVQSRIDSQDPSAQPFRLRDDDGDLPVTRLFYPMDHRLEIHLAREARGKVYVSAGWGENPPLLPQDVERRMPILAFTDFSVT